MNRRSSPGLGQWITVSVMVVATIFLLAKLYQYAGLRTYYPTGLTIGGVDVGGMDQEEAGEAISNRYIEAPVTISHEEESFSVSPSEAEFTLDWETMFSQADQERSQQDFWAGFWGFLWGRAVEVNPVPLAATHNREALREVILDISTLADKPAQPAQPVPQTLSFQYGEAGTVTNVEASFADIEAALYRPSQREARLVVEPRLPARPQQNLLTRLLVNRLQDFEQTTDGVGSLFIMDLETGDEIAINANAAMSGMDMLKAPIVMEVYRVLDRRPTLTHQELISNTLVARPDDESANALLNIVAGQDDPLLGAELVTASMQRLGLVNTFMTAPYDEDGRETITTPANSQEGLRTDPTPQMQTTAEDMGTLLSMIYYCAQGQGGAIAAAYDGDVTQAECQEILDYLAANNIDSLLEEGAPPDTTVAHRHGWISDTHGDAGIIFTPGGDYVIAGFLYKPNWLEWEISSPLLADISRATYNYLNFDNPYLNGVNNAN